MWMRDSLIHSNKYWIIENGPPLPCNYQEGVDGKLKSNLEWPNCLFYAVYVMNMKTASVVVCNCYKCKLDVNKSYPNHLKQSAWHLPPFYQLYG